MVFMLSLDFNFSNDCSLDDYLVKADILRALKRKKDALRTLEEIREIAENLNSLDCIKEVDKKN